MDQYAEAASSVVQNVVPDILSITSFIFGRGYVPCFVSLLTSLKSHTNRVELSFFLANKIGLFQGEFECSIMSFCNISPTCLFTSCSHAYWFIHLLFPRLLVYSPLVPTPTGLFTSCSHAYWFIHLLFPRLLVYSPLVPTPTGLFTSCSHAYWFIHLLFPRLLVYSPLVPTSTGLFTSCSHVYWFIHLLFPRLRNSPNFPLYWSSISCVANEVCFGFLGLAANMSLYESNKHFNRSFCLISRLLP